MKGAGVNQLWPIRLNCWFALGSLSLLSPPVAAQPPDAVATEFEAWQEQYPWQVSPEVITRAHTLGAVPETNFDEMRVPTSTLPDLLTFASGDNVSTPAAWRVRREELLELFRTEVFGAAPPRPDSLRFTVVDHDTLALEGLATFKRIAISFNLGPNHFGFHLSLFIPNRRTGVAPVVLLLRHRDSTPVRNAAKSSGDFWPVDWTLYLDHADSFFAQASPPDLR